MTSTHRWKPLALRLWRVALLALAVIAIRRSHPAAAFVLTVNRIHDFFPTAAEWGRPQIALLYATPHRILIGLASGKRF